MASTVIRGAQIKDSTVQRHDLDTSTVGQAVVTKIVQGANVTLSSTGADSGTGDVTINVPGGGAGPAGLNAFNTTSAGFTVPPVGSTVTVTLNDASWVVVGQMIYCDQAGGGVGQAGALQVTAKTGNQITLLNPTPTPAIPPADSTQAGLLKQLSGNTTDFVDGTNACQNLATAVQPTIWSVRLKSFNSLGNSTFEVDQRNADGSVAVQSGFPLDRWALNKGGTMVCSAQQNTASPPVVLPGTSFAITRKFLRITLNTQETSLAAGDYLQVNQPIEGIQLRELISDTHSVSLLVRSSVAGLSFGLALRDAANAYSLTKLCTISSAGVWTMISLPSLPIWTPSATWGLTPGVNGYQLALGLACGTTYTTPANNTWQNGNFFGAVGQSNFAASPVNSTFDIAFIQHEPGAVCTTPMDVPFSGPNGNLMLCQRYFTKSYDYAVKPGTVSTTGAGVFWGPNVSTSGIYTPVAFGVRMAKDPTVTAYSPDSGVINAIRNLTGGGDAAVASIVAPGEYGFGGFNTSVAQAANISLRYHYTADTGW